MRFLTQEFCDNVATEKWIMQGGRLRIEGESVDTSKDESVGHGEGLRVWQNLYRLHYII